MAEDTVRDLRRLQALHALSRRLVDHLEYIVLSGDEVEQATRASLSEALDAAYVTRGAVWQAYGLTMDLVERQQQQRQQR